MTDTADTAPPQADSAADPPLPTSPEQLLAFLESLGIAAATHAHPPLMTVEDSKRLRGELPGGHCKNLFLRDHRKRMWLVVVGEDRPVDMKDLQHRLGSGRLSFGSAERLWQALGVRPGAVTPLAALNDRDGTVTVAVDAALLRHDPLNFHPLTNDRTTAIPPDGLLAFLRATGHEPVLVDLDS